MDFFRRKQISAMLLFCALLFPVSMIAMEQDNGNFSFELRNVTIKEVFKYIEKKSEYVFLYSTDKNLLKKVSIAVKEKNITQVLDELLQDTGLVYEIDGKQILVQDKKKATDSSTQKTQQKKKKTIRGIISDDATQEPIIGGYRCGKRNCDRNRFECGR